MRQKQNKEVFINTLKKEIEVREQLQKFYKETFNLVVLKFAGKIYNKRFETALNDALKSYSPNLFATCTQKGPDSYSNYKDLFYIEVVLKGRTDPHNYSEYEALYTKVMLKSDDGYNQLICAMMDEKQSIIWYENFVKYTQEIKDSIKNYNKYLKTAQKVADAINTYKDLPFRFRRNIEFTTKFYLNS